MNASTPVVVIHPSDRAVDAWVASRPSHHSMVLVVDTMPGDYDAARALSEAVLTGLGKGPSLTCGTAGADELAAAWLSLGEHTDALIVDAQLIPIVRLEPFIKTLAAFHIRPWLLLAAADDNHAAVADWVRLVERYGGQLADLADVAAAFPDADEGRISNGGVAGAVPALPRLPAADGIVFRSVCRDLLDDDDFATVDALFVGAVNVLRDELASVDGPQKTRSFENLLKAKLVTTATTDEFVLWIRAAQIAGLCRGFHVLVNNWFLFGAAEVVPRTGKATVEGWWERFDRYREPVYGAVAALYSADITVDDIGHLTVSHIADPATDDSITVDTCDGPVTIQANAARFVTAQRRLRLLSGAGPDRNLLGTFQPISVRRSRLVAERLSIPQSELGVKVADLQTRHRAINVTTWLKRHGITITKLERSATDAPIEAER